MDIMTRASLDIFQRFDRTIQHGLSVTIRESIVPTVNLPNNNGLVGVRKGMPECEGEMHTDRSCCNCGNDISDAGCEGHFVHSPTGEFSSKQCAGDPGTNSYDGSSECFIEYECAFIDGGGDDDGEEEEELDFDCCGGHEEGSKLPRVRASSSSFYYNEVAANLIDGDEDDLGNQASTCYTTENHCNGIGNGPGTSSHTTNPWMMIDMGERHEVLTVRAWARDHFGEEDCDNLEGDGCCCAGAFAQGTIEIRINDAYENPTSTGTICAFNDIPYGDMERWFPCTGTGQFVYIYAKGSDRNLQVQEMEVWGNYNRFTPKFKTRQYDYFTNSWAKYTSMRI